MTPVSAVHLPDRLKTKQISCLHFCFLKLERATVEKLVYIQWLVGTGSGDGMPMLSTGTILCLVLMCLFSQMV